MDTDRKVIDLYRDKYIDTSKFGDFLFYLGVLGFVICLFEMFPKQVSDRRGSGALKGWSGTDRPARSPRVRKILLKPWKYQHWRKS